MYYINGICRFSKITIINVRDSVNYTVPVFLVLATIHCTVQTDLCIRKITSGKFDSFQAKHYCKHVTYKKMPTLGTVTLPIS